MDIRKTLQRYLRKGLYPSAALGLCILAACAQPQNAVDDIASSSNEISLALNAPSQAESVAALLSLGHAAFEAAPIRPQTLANVLYALDSLGARPANTAADPLAPWRLASGALSKQTTAPYRGRLLGPAYTSAELGAGARYTLEQLFVAGQEANVAVSATQHSQSLKLSVKAPDGQTICSVSASSAQQCSWVPLFTQRYKIGVRNEGDFPVTFFLTTD